MFGMGGSEIIVILIVALLFLGPDKLPQAAKSISKGIRDIKKQSRALQQQIESDEQIGGAIRDLKSALRGEEPVPKQRIKPRIKKELTEGTPADGAAADGAPATPVDPMANGTGPDDQAGHDPDDPGRPDPVPANGADNPVLTMPALAGEPGDVSEPGAAGADDELAAMVKPAPGTVAKGS